jgi:hypothetical protein
MHGFDLNGYLNNRVDQGQYQFTDDYQMQLKTQYQPRKPFE